MRGPRGFARRQTVFNDVVVVSRVGGVVADGVEVDGSAVVGVVVDERRRDDGLVAVELTVVGAVVDER